MINEVKTFIRKLICIALCVALLAAFAACGGAMDAGNATAQDGQSTQSGENPSSDAASREDENRDVADASTYPAVLEGKEISGTITVSAYESMTYSSILEAAAEAFNEKYPDVEVIIDTFTAMPDIKRSESADGRMATASVQMEDNPQERSDYANKINTKLMSGEGPDILAVDVIPVAKYVESGLLENLAPYMEQDPEFDRSDYRVNILDAVTWKGGTWFMPMDYMFNYYTYDITLITGEQTDFGAGSAFTTEQLLDIAIPLFDGETKIINSSAYSNRGGSLWARLLREHWVEFVDIAGKKANFTDGKFVDLLNSVIGYNDDGYIPESFTGQIDREEMMEQMMKTPTDRYYFKPKSNSSLLTYYLSGTQSRFNVGFVNAGGGAAIEDDDLIAGIAANADGSVPFTYSQAYAVNSDSKNKHTAWAFIKFMLSGEMQASGAAGMGSIRGLPLHNETRAKQLELMMASMAARMSGDSAFRRDPGGVPGESPFGFGRIGGAPQDDADGAAPGGAVDRTQGDSDGASGGSETAPGEADRAPGGAVDGAANDSVAASDGTGGQPSGANSSPNSSPETAVNPQDNGMAEIDPEIIEEYNNTIETFSDQINAFEIQDTIIDDMIQAETNYFFDGVKTADEVAATLQSKVELYLNE